MNIIKDERTLYFSDEEIDNEPNGEKKVFVTKRINGKESHIKAEQRKKSAKHLENKKESKKENKKEYQKQEENEIDDDEIFNFNSEIVLGVNIPDEKNKNKKKNKKEKSKNPKKNQSARPKKKKRKKKKISKKAIGICTALLLIGAIIILALTAPIFNIVSINVQGNKQISENTITSLSGLKKGENIFKFNNSVADKIKENAYIENVKIQRKLPGTVIITVEERTIKYQVRLLNSYVYIDKNGYILENSSEKKNVTVLARNIYKRR